MDFERGLIELDISKDTVERIINHFAGEMIYVPRKMKSKKIRDAEIKAKFNGDNYRELAKEFDLTVRYVRKIV